MPITIQQIAELAGVSRGTVDRALNNRGRINPEVEEKVKEIANQYGYVSKRKRVKKTTSKSVVKLGVITQLSESPFMIKVNEGIRDAKEALKLKDLEVLVKESNTVDENVQINQINELISQGIDGLAIMPIESEEVRFVLNELTIPVVTFNSDIVGTKRSCFVGLNNRKSGRVCAGLMALMTGNRGKMLIITGFFSNSVCNMRVDGFVEEAKKTFPEMEIVGVHSSFDDEDEVKKIILNALETYPDLNGIVIASSGQNGVKKAFSELKTKKRPFIIIYDSTPDNKKLLRENMADFLIDQDGYVQGYKPLFILNNIISQGIEPKKEFMYTKISIRTKYSI
jgi:LacI family transcriptional regulator